MFDDLREVSEEPASFEPPAEFDYETYEEGEPRGRFLGMTPGQRLFISILLLAMVLVLGAMCLLVTERVWLF